MVFLLFFLFQFERGGRESVSVNLFFSFWQINKLLNSDKSSFCHVENLASNNVILLHKKQLELVV